MGNVYITNAYLQPTPGQTNESLTVSSSVVQFTSANWSDNTKVILIDVQDADCFVTFDGSTPSASNGVRLYAGEKYPWHVEMARKAKFIRASADLTIRAVETTV